MAASLAEVLASMEVADIAQRSSETTDAALASQVQRYLIANRNGFQRISVSAETGTVRLSGPVGSFFLRQMAIVMAKRVAGVLRVIDDLDVDLRPTDSRQMVER